MKSLVPVAVGVAREDAGSANELEASEQQRGSAVTDFLEGLAVLENEDAGVESSGEERALIDELNLDDCGGELIGVERFEGVEVGDDEEARGVASGEAIEGDVVVHDEALVTNVEGIEEPAHVAGLAVEGGDLGDPGGGLDFLDKLQIVNIKNEDLVGGSADMELVAM